MIVLLFISESDIKQAITMAETMDALEGAFKVHSQGKTVTPLRTHLELEEINGIGLFMPSWIGPHKNLGIKALTLLQDNPSRNLPAIQGTMQLFDGDTGAPMSLLEASYITKLRTGASSGVATRYFAPEGATKAAIIGTGAQSYTQLWAMLTGAPSIDTVCIFDVFAEKAQEYKEMVEADFKNVNFQVAQTAAEAVKEAQVITTCTTSKEPVFKLEDLNQEKVHVNAVGAFKPEMQETDPQVVQKADKVVIDDFEGVMAEAGDLIIPIEKGEFSKEEIYGEIGEVILGEKQKREDGDKITLYKTVGMGSLDVAAAQAIYESAKKNNIGKELSLK